jgi:hypothetical protein
MKSRHTATKMYAIAALMFLIAGIVGIIGDNGFGIVFIVLSVAFVILALNTRASTDGPNDG